MRDLIYPTVVVCSIGIHELVVMRFFQVGRSENLEILDVSEEACVFALSLAEKHSNNRLVIASRGEKPNFDLPLNVTYKQVDFRKDFNDIDDIGMFDVIIFNEVTNEISDLGAFFTKLSLLLKDNAPIIILSRPKNPPLPVPECCHLLWRKLAPTRDELISYAKAVSRYFAEVPYLCPIDYFLVAYITRHLNGNLTCDVWQGSLLNLPMSYSADAHSHSQPLPFH
uniref:Methyltranfer_dom domain-containing protein n=1 Tax=Angiostrongylus cantonensis TaxID=6313 RepID=A0A0K0CV81_ANGCA